MKVVFETNVFISALAIPGGRGDTALLRILEGREQLYVSKAIIREVISVLGRKFGKDREELAKVAVLLSEIGNMVSPDREISILDEADNRILECAIEAAADAVVTGDREMLALGTVEGVRILSLREYLQDPPLDTEA